MERIDKKRFFTALPSDYKAWFPLHGIRHDHDTKTKRL